MRLRFMCDPHQQSRRLQGTSSSRFAMKELIVMAVIIRLRPAPCREEEERQAREWYK